MNKQQLFLQRKAPELWTAINNKNLWFVRSVEIYNTAGIKHLQYDSTERYLKSVTDILDRKQIFELPERALFNQSINLLVLPFTSRDIWDCRKYIFVAPMSEFVGELVGGTHQDYLTIGFHTYTEESYLLVPRDEIETVKRDFPKLKSTIIGYNYPETILGQEGMKCFDKLSETLAPGLETPRNAVENLFDKISKEKGIDIWRFPKEKQYTGKGLKPITHGSNLGNNEMSIRVDNKGNKINVDALLEKFMDLFTADGFYVSSIGERIEAMKKDLRNVATIKNDKFLSDYTEIDESKSYESKSCEPPVPPANWYVYNISDEFKKFKQHLSEQDRYKPTANRYLTAIYDKSFNIISYLEILHKYKKVHPDNIEYIKGFGKPDNKLVDILLILLNKKDFLPLRNIIIDLRDTINEKCGDEMAEYYGTPEFFELASRFNEKMTQITEELHTEIERLKKRNSTLKNTEVRKKLNRSIARAKAQLMGGFKQTRSKTVKKTRRM